MASPLLSPVAVVYTANKSEAFPAAEFQLTLANFNPVPLKAASACSVKSNSVLVSEEILSNPSPPEGAPTL